MLLSQCAMAGVGTLNIGGRPIPIPPWTFTTFTWPAGTSNAGPYSLISVVSNYTVFTPSGSAITEADLTTHQFNHHTKIAWDSGVTMLAFSSAYTNEADGGEQTAIAFSTNKGVSWSSPMLVVPAQSVWTNSPTSGTTTIGQRITYPRNFDRIGGTNYLIAAVDHYYDTVGHEIGDALIACAVFTNQTLGTPFLISTNPYFASNGYPAVVPTYNASLGPILMTNAQVYGTWGGNEHVFETAWTGWKFDGTNYFVEPNTFSADGTATNLYRIYRYAGGSGSILYAFQATSTNGGTTFTKPYQTEIPNSPSEVFAMRLSDSRYAVLGNPVSISGHLRDPLYLAITEPNTTTITNVSAIRQGVTETPVWQGYAKSGGASYVSAVQAGNYLYVGYSLQKETIGFSRVLIPGLADSNND